MNDSSPAHASIVQNCCGAVTHPQFQKSIAATCKNCYWVEFITRLHRLIGCGTISFRSQLSTTCRPISWKSQSRLPQRLDFNLNFLSSSLTHSRHWVHWGLCSVTPPHTLRVSTRDGSSPEVSTQQGVYSLRSWSSQLFRGRPGHHLQLGSGRRPSDRSMWHRKAWWAGVSSGSLATCPNSELRHSDNGRLDPAQGWQQCQRGSRLRHRHRVAVVIVFYKEWICAVRCLENVVRRPPRWSAWPEHSDLCHMSCHLLHHWLFLCSQLCSRRWGFHVNFVLELRLLSAMKR